MNYITVYLPIEIPNTDYCWDHKVSYQYFDNGGPLTCSLKIGDPKYDIGGRVSKPTECIRLKKVE